MSNKGRSSSSIVVFALQIPNQNHLRAPHMLRLGVREGEDQQSHVNRLWATVWRKNTRAICLILMEWVEERRGEQTDNNTIRGMDNYFLGLPATGACSIQAPPMMRKKQRGMLLNVQDLLLTKSYLNNIASTASIMSVGASWDSSAIWKGLPLFNVFQACPLVRDPRGHPEHTGGITSHLA